MTTLNTQLQRMAKSMVLMEAKKHPSIIPPQLLKDTKGIVFLKKLPKGKQTSQASQGLFMMRQGLAEWSKPVALHMSKGDLYWGSQPAVDRVDVFILIQDAELVETFRCFGQIGFNCDSANKMKKGVCIENSDMSFIKFATVLSERPDLLQGRAFSYGLSNGHFFPVHIENPILQFRTSSNRKFYECRNLDMQTLVLEGVDVNEPAKAALILEAQACTARHFDISKRFPEYADIGEEAFSPKPETSPALSSPDPTNIASPSMGRQWSSSTCSSNSSSTNSDSDNEYSGYIARGSDLAMLERNAASQSERWDARVVKVPEAGRERATSFDFGLV